MLKVKGNKIFDTGDKEVRLIGVNRAGLEWDAKDKRIVKSIQQACDDWKCNVIRVPLDQDRWFGFAEEQDDDRNGELYRKIVDKIANELQKRNKYMILDLHWNNMNEWGHNVGQHKMPDLNSIIFWKDVATRYKNHPAVLFSLYNEPHSVSWDIWKNGGYITEHFKDDETGAKKQGKYMTAGYQQLTDTVRHVGANNIVVLAGLDWGFTLEEVLNGYEIDQGNGNGIIYDSHIYPWKPLDWDTHVPLKLAEKYPILIGEFGHYGDTAKPNEGKQQLKSHEFMTRLLEWIHKHQYNFTAWCFHPHCGPDMLKNWNNEPTDYFGIYVKEYLDKYGV